MQFIPTDINAVSMSTRYLKTIDHDGVRYRLGQVGEMVDGVQLGELFDRTGARALDADGNPLNGATAAYGDRKHPDVVTLRAWRDEVLVRHPMGRVFVRAYWHVGPIIAARIHSG